MSFGDDRPSRPDEAFPPNPYAAPQAVDVDDPTMLPTRPGEMTLNPWVHMWTQPRATIRQLLDTGKHDQNLLVVALAGAANGLSNVQNATPNLGVAGAIMAGAIGGVIGGILFWLLFSWLIKITAGWLGGVASLQDMRTAYAWGQVPAIWAAPLSIALILLGGENPDAALQNPGIAIAFMVIGVAMMVIGIWSMIVICKAVGEANLFSAWRGWGSMILAGLLLAVPAMVIVFAVIAIAAAVG